MSKSRRVFLSMQGDDDFWGNGDRFEEHKLSKMNRRKCRGMMDTAKDDVLDEHFFKQNNLVTQELEQQNAKSNDMFRERQDWNSSTPLEKINLVESEDPVTCPENTEAKIHCSEVKVTEKMPLELDDEFYNNFREYFSSRPEVIFLTRSMHKDAAENYDKQFIDLYEKTRKRLELRSSPQINQILRCTSNTNATSSEIQLRNRQAVIVSNFREPDRRLGRYSKYYYHHNVGPEVYSRKVFVGGLPSCVKESDILNFFSRYGRLQVDWPSKHYECKSDSDPSLCNEPISSSSYQPSSHLAMVSPPFGEINPFMRNMPAQSESSQTGGFGRISSGSIGGFLNPGMAQVARGNLGFGSTKSDGSINGDKRQHHLGYVFLLFEKERSVRDLVLDCFEEEEGLFITLESSTDSIRVQIRPWLLADAEFLMDFNVPINTKLVAFIGGVPRPLKAVELAHFFEQTYGHVVCVGIDIDNKFKYPRGSGRVAFSDYDAYVQAITDRYIVLDHEDIHKRVEIKPYFFHNQSCEECSGRYHRQHAPYFCPSLECFQYYCEPCWHKMHSHPSRFHHMPVVKGV